MMENEYRIVRSAPMAFKLQVRRWWWPVWVPVHRFHNIESAEEYAFGHAGGLVKYLGTMLEERKE